MPNITRIKATESKDARVKDRKSSIKTAKNPTPNKLKKTTRPKMGRIFKILWWPFELIFRPLTPLSRYMKGSWQELRKVRWPNRRATWKMALAAIIYTGLFMALIVALDAGFTLLFNQLLK